MLTASIASVIDRNSRQCGLRILLVQHCSERTGSTISGLLAAEGFRHQGWDVDVVFGSHGPMIAAYADIGCRTHVVPHKSWLRGGNLLQSARRISQEWRNAAGFERLMAELRPDVVYVNSLVSLAGAVASRRRKIPCVWHIRELYDNVGGEMRVPAFGGRRLVRGLVGMLATRRIAISRVVVENILGTTGPLRLDVVPNAVSTEFFELTEGRNPCRARFGLPDDVPVVGVPGTLRPVKGHTFFLKAAACVSQVRPDCVFAITGTGEPEYEARLRQEVERLRLGSQVRFLGTVADMPRFYRACDLICVPSQSESFGRTVIEAFAIGTPVVATSVGGMRETIENDVTGRLVAYGDVVALGNTICSLLSDPQLSAALSAGGLRVAHAEYSASLYQERLIRVVSGVCRSRSTEQS